MKQFKYCSSWFKLELNYYAPKSKKKWPASCQPQKEQTVNRYLIKSQVYLVPSSPSSIVSPHQCLVVVVFLGQVVVKDTVGNTLKQKNAMLMWNYNTETGGNTFKHFVIIKTENLELICVQPIGEGICGPTEWRVNNIFVHYKQTILHHIVHNRPE